MIKTGKKILVALLSATVAFSSIALAPVTAYAEETGDDTESQDVRIEEEPDDSNIDTIGHYSADQVATDLLVPHTGKTSELDNSPALEAINSVSDDDFINLSCSSEFYDSLNFSSSEMTSNARSYATSEDLQNPLSGYTFVDPNELLIGSVNRSESHHVLFQTLNDVQAKSAFELADVDNHEKNTNDFKMTEDGNNQTHNGIPIDVDGDGIDEFAYYSLYYNDTSDPDTKGDSIWMDIFERRQDSNDTTKYNWVNVHHFNTYMSHYKYIQGIEAQESKGYVSLAAGDYDGDGKEELAYYMPDKGGSGDASDARVVIRNIDKDANGNYSNSKLAEINVDSFTSDYRQMSSDRRLPTVALSTTSTRLGEVKSASVGAKQYKTYDDLVMTVSVPTEYRGKNLDLNTITKIFSFESSTPTERFRYEYLPFTVDGNMMRMNYVNTCDADLNGDGFKEIVAAGVKEHNMSKPSGAKDDNRCYGKIDNYHNFVNIITCNSDGKYEMIWAQPKEIESVGTLDSNHFNSVEPIGVCAGHYMYGTAATKDQICVQGVIFDCQDALISGPVVYTNVNSDGDQVYIMTDSQPYYNKDNFPDTVSFSKEYAFDYASKGAEGDSAWISTCVSGHFLDETDVDQIAVISSDAVDANDDNIYFDITIMSHYRQDTTSDPEWTYKCYDNYINKKDEDEQGTTLFITFINDEEDTFYYRYAGTYSSYSAPVLYSIVQAPPYYKEANSCSASKYSITTGVSNYEKLSLGVGVAVSDTMSTDAEFFKQGLNFGMGSQFGPEFAYNHTWTHQKTVTKSIYLSTDKDYAVCYAVPIVVNMYEVVKTKDPNEEPEMYQVTEPLTPVFTALTIDEYNAAVSGASANYDPSNTDEIDPSEGTPIIDKSKLPLATPGDPVAYPHKLDDIVDKDKVEDTDSSGGSVGADITNDFEKSETSVTFTNSQDNSGGVTLKAQVNFTIGFTSTIKTPLGITVTTKGNVSLILSGSLGISGGRTNSDGVSFLTTYTGLSKELPFGLSGFSDSSDKYYKLSQLVNGIVPYDSNIYHYDPNDDTMYFYKSVSVCFPTGKKVNEDAVSDGTNTDDFGADVFQMSYYTDTHGFLPPEPPKDFTIQSISKNGDTTEFTLIWNSKNRNEERKADGYNIYMSDINPTSKQVFLQNHEGVIYPSQDSDYTTYTVKLKNTEFNDSTSFFIAPVYTDSSTNDSGNIILNVTEGILSNRCDISSVDLYTNGNLIVEKQPKVYLMQDDGKDETAEFSIEVSKNTENSQRVYFNWEEFDEDSDSWVSVKKEEIAVANTDSGNYRSDYSFNIPAADKQSYVDKGIRCVVSCGNYSVNSNITTLRFAPDRLIGDVNNDKFVDVLDALLVQEYSVEKKDLDDDQLYYADVNNDGSVDILDASMIQKYAAEKISDFPKKA